jgi:hypothetical protein
LPLLIFGSLHIVRPFLPARANGRVRPTWVKAFQSLEESKTLNTTHFAEPVLAKSRTMSAG